MTSTQAHLGRAGRPGQASQVSQSVPIRDSELQNVGLAAPARSKEQVWGPEGQDRHGAAALLVF